MMNIERRVLTVCTYITIDSLCPGPSPGPSSGPGSSHGPGPFRGLKILQLYFISENHFILCIAKKNHFILGTKIELDVLPARKCV